VDEAPEAEVADDGPAQFDYLLLGVVLEQLVEEFVVDVLVVQHQALRVVQCRFLGRAEVLVAPGPNLRDGLLVQGFRFP
jgi:hypothetical protein